MAKSRLLNIFSMITSIVIFLIFFVGLYLQLFANINFGDLPKYISSGELLNNVKALCFNFGFINAVVCFIAAFLMFFIYPRSIRKGRCCAPYLFKSIRYIAAGMSVVCLFFSLTILGTSFSFKEIFITGNSAYKDLMFVNYSAIVFRIVIPILSVVQYLILEIEQTRGFSHTFVPYAFILAYGIFIMVFISTVASKDIKAAADLSPYYFFLYSEDLINASVYAPYLTTVRTISMLCIVGLVSFILCVLIWLINKVNCELLIGYEYLEVDEANRVIRPLNHLPLNEVYKKGEVRVKDWHTGSFIKKIRTRMYASKLVSKNVYHVSSYNHKLKNWKVRQSGTSSNSFKIFPTRKEAIAYAKVLVNQNGGVVRIHSAEEAPKKD